METEQIIQRFLDEKHITVKEAFQMIKDLVKKEVILPKIDPDDYKKDLINPIICMYGVRTDFDLSDNKNTSYSITTTD